MQPTGRSLTPDVAALPVWSVRTLTRQVNVLTCREAGAQSG